MGYEKPSDKLTFYKAFFSPQLKFLIHTVLQCLSLKTTSWNEFSSSMAFAIICLATNQKFNFSKLIFDSMVKNINNLSENVYMYPRFLQVFLDKQFYKKVTHNKQYITPSHTKKIFSNMKRIGKGFSGTITPLFQIMVVQGQQKLVKVQKSTLIPNTHPQFYSHPHHTIKRPKNLGSHKERALRYLSLVLLL